MWVCELVALAALAGQLLHAALGGWRDYQPIHSVKSALIGVVVFFSTWLVTTPLVALAVWAFWLGDTGRWWATPVVSAVLAAVFALFVCCRFVGKRANNRYAHVQLALSLTILLAMSGMYSSNTFHMVDGWTPESAVDKLVRSNPGFQSAKIEPVDSEFEMRRYRVLLDGEQRATISLRKVAFGLGWGASSSSWVGTANDELAELRERAATMQYYKDPINLRNILEGFIRNHPDTPEAEEATQWLAEVVPHVVRIERAKGLGGRSFLLKRLPRLMSENRGKPVDLTREQQIAVQLFRLIEAKSLTLYYHRFTCEYRNETVLALREVGADDAADWLAEANRLLEPHLDPSAIRIRPESREEVSRVMITQVPHLEEFSEDIQNRLIVFCEDHASDFPSLRRD